MQIYAYNHPEVCCKGDASEGYVLPCGEFLCSSMLLCYDALAYHSLSTMQTKPQTQVSQTGSQTKSLFQLFLSGASQ